MVIIVKNVDAGYVLNAEANYVLNANKKQKFQAMNKPILHLNLIHNWYDMVEADIKLEEYRDITSHWSNIFYNGHIKIKGKYYHPTDVVICFSNGYQTNRRQQFRECSGLSVKCGNPEWGAKEGVQYYTLSIGKRV